MIDTTAVIMILGFIGVIGTTIGAMWWLDRRLRADIAVLRQEGKDRGERLNRVEVGLAGLQVEVKAQGERLDRMEERFDRQDERFDRQDERHRVLEGKVDRVQGSLDVLIHGYRYVPPLERERQERERQAGEPVGD